MKAIMNTRIIARRVLARFIGAMEHDTPEALKKYLHDHPDADPKNHSVKKPGKGKPEGGAAGGWKDPKVNAQFVKSLQGAEKTVGALTKAKDKLNKLVDGRKVNITDVETQHKAVVDHHKKLSDEAEGAVKHMEAYLDKISDVEIPDRRTQDLVVALHNSVKSLKKAIDAEKGVRGKRFDDLNEESRKKRSEGKSWVYSPITDHADELAQSAKKIADSLENVRFEMYEITHKT